MKEVKPEEKSRLRMVYGMMFYNFLSIWGASILVNFFNEYYVLLDNILYSSLGEVGVFLAKTPLMIVGFICAVTPFVVGLKHKNKPHTTAYGFTHLSYIVRLYFIFILASVISYVLIVTSVLAMKASPQFGVFMPIAGIVIYQIISFVYFIKTCINYGKMNKNETCD